MSFGETLRLVVAPPHRAGWPFIGGGIVLLALGLVLASWLAWLAFAFVLFSAYFFRDPERVPPDRAEAILAPADGKVVSITPVAPPVELGLGDAPRWRVSIFLSVLNVHVNRVPADGVVTRISYRHGAFLNASVDKASEQNERNAIALRLPGGQQLAVVQIAGLIARRIRCDIHEGDAVQAGARFGIIRFGSRTDLYLPEGVLPLVSIGQTMVGGETVIAELPR
ncbi:MAG TPA: phosphatidylserine decarboxylase [Acetobacteraceae bacterium]|nr:phosphatidylserine decarboxylase [Acetobacteraceae bacterium]